ncbi:adenosylmethionine decarboxylase [Phyllobacterium leguminum]|uniref:S-adenosylmethionine decarboxylase n=1 Tax=Phyllobacterium leguminum TaxID=314237 RepID=A0A318SXK8_9HYPH|nr:adenosylmethionine decarboxylase [Phyllobacterium leguminum]PYE86682.1 S-adenosylmethionine decarboxylase [Phyllobacterium leguminum]
MKFVNEGEFRVRQLFVDAYGCNMDLSDVDKIAAVAERGILSVGAQIRNRATEYFQPHGATIVYILAESHVIITTWPEYKYAAIDVLLCNLSMDPRRVSEEVIKLLSPSDINEQLIDRLIYTEGQNLESSQKMFEGAAE